MIFLISLAAAILFTVTAKKGLKHHPVPFYLIFTGISAAVLFLKLNKITFGSSSIATWILPVFDKAALGTAFFVLVMYAGALPVKTKAVKILMPIRGQLSILACILTLGHNAAYGKTYFLWLFTDHQRLSGYLLGAAICSLCMISIMLPLFVTSFVGIRRKMHPKKWKKLQRHAYLFYALLYVHIMLLNVPQALHGVSRCRWNVLVYTAVFLGYLICRLLRAYARKRSTFPLGRAQCMGAAVSLLIGFAMSAAVYRSAEKVDLTGEIPITGKTPEEESMSEEEGVPEEESMSEEEGAPEEERKSEAEDVPEEESMSEEEGAPEEESKSEAEDVPEEERMSEEKGVSEAETMSDKKGGTVAEAVAETEDTSLLEGKSETECLSDTEMQTGGYQDGTYQGTAFGYIGDITVEVTVENGEIISICFTSYEDEEDYRSYGNAMLQKILSDPEGEADTISGATFTTGAVRQAYQKALEQAK